MKKVLAATAMVLALAACAGKGEQKPQPQGGNAAVEQALQECRTMVEANQKTDQAQNQAAFDACMKEKGFVRPAGQQPAPAAPASAPAN